MRRSLLIGLAMIFALLVAGCQQAAEKAIEQTTGVKVDTSAVPAELTDFPVPGGFTYGGGGSMSKDGDKVTSASWTGKASVADVESFFKKEMPGRGWKEESIITSDDGSLLNYSKDDQTGVMITASKDESGDTTIAIVYGKTNKTPTPAEAAAPTAAAETPEATPAESESESTPTPAAPETTSNADLAPQLKALPIPSGFAVEKDSYQTVTDGGKLSLATARWFGKEDAKQVFAFFKKEIPAAGWTELATAEDSDGYTLAYGGKDELTLAIQIWTRDAGTEIQIGLLPE